MHVNTSTGHVGPLMPIRELDLFKSAGPDVVTVIGDNPDQVRRAAHAIARTAADPRKKARRKLAAASRRNNRKS